jgi:hypothetical protein
MTHPAIVLRPIKDDDIHLVADFLHQYLNQRISTRAWATGIDAHWVEDAPNHGYMLINNDQVVGANIAFYSERQIRGVVERVCNMGALCVIERYRSHAVRLVRAILKQPNYTFTDLSPSGNVVELNRRLGFQFLNTTTVLAVNTPRPPKRSVTIVTDPTLIEPHLRYRDLQIFRDHSATASRRMLIIESSRQCLLIARRDRRKGLPLFMTVLYVSEPELFRRAYRHVFNHFLIHDGAPITILEGRIVGDLRPVGSIALSQSRPKMFKSRSLTAVDIDYLYSELTQIAW